MILYKNVDISDLASIMEHGILSADECGNNNWDDGHRANNATEAEKTTFRLSIETIKPTWWRIYK